MICFNYIVIISSYYHFLLLKWIFYLCDIMKVSSSHVKCLSFTSYMYLILEDFPLTWTSVFSVILAQPSHLLVINHFQSRVVDDTKQTESHLLIYRSLGHFCITFPAQNWSIIIFTHILPIISRHNYSWIGKYTWFIIRGETQIHRGRGKNTRQNGLKKIQSSIKAWY